MVSISFLIVSVLTISCTLSFDVALNQHWDLWKQKYNKQYSTNEGNIR